VDILTLYFELVQQGESHLVRMRIDGGDPIEDRFQIELLQGSEVTKKFDAIEDNACDYADVSFAGGQLWLALMSRKVREAFQAAYKSRAKNDLLSELSQFTTFISTAKRFANTRAANSNDLLTNQAAAAEKQATLIRTYITNTHIAKNRFSNPFSPIRILNNDNN
jgi:hypothetical protein